MADQELRLRAIAEGTNEAARQLDDVAKAQQRVADASEAVVDVSDLQIQATDKSAASTEDFLGILRQVHPALGQFAETIFRGSKVAGDLADKQIDLAAIGAKLTTVLKNNGAAMLLLGAGGAVVAAIGAIASVMGKLAAEAERATKAIKEQSAALNELEGAKRSAQSELEIQSDKRGEGGFTADQARAASNLRERVRSKFGDAIPDSDLDASISALHGRGFNDDEITQAAFLKRRGLELDPKQRPDILRALFNQSLQRNAGAFETFAQREATQSGESVTQAGIQGTGVGGVTLDLKGQVKRSLGPGTSSEKLDRFTELAQRFGSEEGLNQAVDRAALVDDPSSGQKSFVLPDTPGGSLGTNLSESIPLNEFTELKQVMRDLTNAVERNTSQRGESPTINNDNRGARFIGPDARSRDLRRVNHINNIRERAEQR